MRNIKDRRRKRVLVARPMPSLCSLLVVAAAGGCGDSISETEPWTVRDSAGVEIVESLRPSWPDGYRWHVDPVPVVEIDGAPDGPFFNLIGVVRIRDGRIVLANQSSSQLLFFDSQGRFMEATGRDGEGPGEFRDISHVVYCGGDSITVYDRRTLQASVLTLQGDFVRSSTPPSLVENDVWPQSVACRPDGTTMVVGWGRDARSEAGAGRRRRIVPVLLLEAGVDRPTQIGEFDGAESQHWLDATGSGWWGAAPFGKQTSILLVDDHVYVASADDHELAEYDLRGSLARIIRWNAQAIPVTSEDIQAFEATLLDSLTDERRRLTEPLLERVQYPEFMPPYRAVLADPSRHLWVEAYRREQETGSVWIVFSPEGRMLGNVDMPPGLEVRQIGEDFVLGVMKDEVGVESVQLFRLSR